MGIADSKTVPKREARLDAIETFGGPLRDLVKHPGGGCLINCRRSFSQTCNCQMGLSLSMLNTMPDIVIIKHGPVGCGNSSQNDKNFTSGLRARDIKVRPLIWASTNLNENDIINGGEKKLREAIISLDRLHRPAAIVVLTTCAPSIIGDDADDVVEKARAETSAKVLLVRCEGFRTKISAMGYDDVYHAILKGLDLEDQREEDLLARRVDNEEFLWRRDYEAQRTINVFNAFSVGRPDELEIERLLNALDLKVNFYPNFAHPDAFRRITRAALNVGLCPTHDDYFLQYLEERYGMPYFIGEMPLGLSNTAVWLQELGRRLGREKEAALLVAQEEELLQKGLDLYRPLLRGKKVFITGGEIRVVVTAMLLEELGCELVGLRGHHYDLFGPHVYGKLLENHADLEVNIATTQTFELANLLKRAKPDLVFAHGGSGVVAAKMGVPVVPVFSQGQYYFGYSGAFSIARRAAKALQNPAYFRNLQANTRLPYKKEWFGRSPFDYIRKE
ncbi:MAG: nitrogenase [Gracilibacteraceae bacterium]|jgi:nitrogenase molybdenum-iron protein alpha chain|nr:nitrogenase [Gracilibacteraceae bacterium]